MGTFESGQKPSETRAERVPAHKVRAFECGVKGSNIRSVVHALTAGKARYQYLLDISDCGDFTFADIVVRSLGAPRDTKKFRHTADYRGKHDWHIGDEVTIGEYGNGVLIDSDSSANFEVAMLDGRWKGRNIHVHPSEITLRG